MTDIRQFRKNAANDGLCSEYSEKWDKCGSKKQLVDLCLEVKGLDYVADAIAKNWGVSPSYIADNFSSYNNGKYVFDNGRYTSKMYCCVDNERVLADTTAMLVVESVVDIELPTNAICEIYATGRSVITLTGNGEAVVICYGEDVEVMADSGIRYKVIHKKEKDKHE